MITDGKKERKKNANEIKIVRKKVFFLSFSSPSKTYKYSIFSFALTILRHCIDRTYLGARWRFLVQEYYRCLHLNLVSSISRCCIASQRIRWFISTWTIPGAMRRHRRRLFPFRSRSSRHRNRRSFFPVLIWNERVVRHRRLWPRAVDRSSFSWKAKRQ